MCEESGGETDRVTEKPKEQQEHGDGQQEIGEESSKEEDPIVEVAHEPDAETEPSMTTGERMTSEGTAPSASARECSMMANAGAESSMQIHSSLSEGLPLQQAAFGS